MLEIHGPTSGSIKDCKPNYERMIEDTKDKLAKNLAFQDAIFNYIGKIILRDKLAELVGELVSEERFLRTKINDLFEQQERA